MNTKHGISLLVPSNGFLIAVSLTAVSALYDQIQHKTIIYRRKGLLPPRTLLHLHHCFILALSFLHILTTVWLSGWLTDQPTDRPTDRPAGRLDGWPTDRLTDWLTDCLPDQPIDRPIDRLNEWLPGWLNDWLTDKLNEQINKYNHIPSLDRTFLLSQLVKKFLNFVFMEIKSSQTSPRQPATGPALSQSSSHSHPISVRSVSVSVCKFAVLPLCYKDGYER